jgi:ABC-type branched-subunit amino acid transport system permease subunit
MLGYPHTQLIDGTLAAQAVFLLCLLISALFLLSNSYSGFVLFLYSVIWICWIPGSYYSMRMAPGRLLYGVTLGVGAMLLILTLMEAIFFGQSSGCSQTPERRLLGIECYQTGAMKSVCTFSVFLFLSQTFFLFVVLRHKDELLPISPSSESQYAKVPQTPVSADL